ncbi:hypothetical protein [Archaeoglobus profundus]|uniref:Uncharacterized protein n=1 Tax=Archaeoglobus profundus (strain DSM 5631 / JCM 9629 / NBRC 100127 / Av18) TaxID=572546 RepID=D2RHV7_ARCPA|nr:hypothetical protein [Archaeoglobus profundus]ADB57882.1 hypothetical protein Arcpr_0819 [Archaeoglobus profundus DSM 5631]
MFEGYLNDGKPPLSQFSMYKRCRKVGYEILPNRRYVDGAIDLVYGVIESINELNRLYKELEFDREVKLEDVRFGNWLLFQCEGESKHMNINIKIREDLSFRVLTFDFDGNKSYVIVRPTIPKRWKKILQNLWFYMQPYYARVPLYGMKPSYVNPANTSKIGEELMRKLGVDKHTASAYVIALRGLKLLNVT